MTLYKVYIAVVKHKRLHFQYCGFAQNHLCPKSVDLNYLKNANNEPHNIYNAKNSFCNK